MKHLITGLVILVLLSCSKNDATPTSRTYRMGFQNSAPRYDDFNLVLKTLALWTPRADAAMITTEVPWDSLYAGKSPVEYVKNNYAGLVEYYRQQKLKLWVFIDPENGLNRTSDSAPLAALGKSIGDLESQKVYRRFVVVMDSLLHPDHLGLALETNLIRVAASPAIYAGVKQAANDAFADVRAFDDTVKISVSVQADLAWGRLLGNGTYQGVAQDYTDFPFIEELGISSYPYFDFTTPDDIPETYYSRLVEDKALPVFVSEGGWSSKSFVGPSGETITCTPELQQRYITVQRKLLDQAKAICYFQLPFTDIDLDHLPPGIDPSIKYFAYLGLVDKDLNPKPALSAWDETFGRRYVY